MRTKICVFSLVLLASTQGIGQDRNQSSFQFTDFSISTGMETYFGNSTDYSFLLDAVSGSPVLPSNFDLYDQQGYSYSSGSGTYEIMAGFAWRSSKEYGEKVNKRLRIGLSYSQPYILSDAYSRNETMPFDTLVSRQTGEEFYVDSTYGSNLGMSYSTNQLSLNTSLLWTTNDDARFSFYGGVSLSLSMNFSSRISIDRTDYSYLEYPTSYEPYFNDLSRNFENEEESFKQPSSFGFGFSSPVGVDWRMGKQGKALNDVHLFAEGRPGVGFNNIPNHELVSQFRASFHLGLRFSM